MDHLQDSELTNMITMNSSSSTPFYGQHIWTTIAIMSMFSFILVTLEKMAIYNIESFSSIYILISMIIEAYGNMCQHNPNRPLILKAFSNIKWYNLLRL